MNGKHIENGKIMTVKDYLSSYPALFNLPIEKGKRLVNVRYTAFNCSLKYAKEKKNISALIS